MQRINLRLAALVLSVVCLGAMPAAAACPPQSTAAAEVAQAMRDMYAAARTDDLDAFHAVAAADFYAFDVGKRFDGDALMTMVKAAHDKGLVYVWSVADPKVEVACDMAVVTYVNNGSVTDADGVHKLTWLESALLRHDGRRWRIRFLHSTRAP